MSSYLVTGRTGFIGSHLVEALVGRGDDVVVLDDFSTGSRENLAPVEGRIRVVEGSIVDPGSCADAMDGVDFVLHQAALGSVRSVADPVATHVVNLTGRHPERAGRGAGCWRSWCWRTCIRRRPTAPSGSATGWAAGGASAQSSRNRSRRSSR